MGQAESKGYKRLPPPMVVESGHVAPPGCVSVGGAYPCEHQYRPPRPTALGRPSSRVHAGVVLVSKNY